MKTNIEKLAYELRLPNIRFNYQEMIEEALSKQLSYEAFLKLILEKEKANRYESSIKNRVKEARFPYIRTFRDRKSVV